MANFVVTTATASGFLYTWKQSFNYTMRSCSSIAHAYLPSTFQVAHGWLPSFYVFMLKGGFQSMVWCAHKGK